MAIKLIGLAIHLHVEFCGFDCLNVKAVSELLKSTLQVSNIHETADWRGILNFTLFKADEIKGTFGQLRVITQHILSDLIRYELQKA